MEPKMVIDEVLKKAAIQGDVRFLRKAVADGKPLEYFKSCDKKFGENMLHIAAGHGKTRFIRVAIKMLPKSVVHFLLCQSDTLWFRTPLGVAAMRGKDRIVMEILNFYENNNWSTPTPSEAEAESSSTRSLNIMPWLVGDISGDTAFLLMLVKCSEECMLKLLSIDPEPCINAIGDERQEWGNPLINALERGFNRVAFKLLQAAPHSVWNNIDQHILVQALYTAPEKCSEEIFQLVLEKNVQFITTRSENVIEDLLHIYGELLKEWIRCGKLFPFKYVLKGSHAPHLKTIVVRQMDGFPALENVIEYADDEDVAVEITQLLAEVYKQEKGQPEVLPKWLIMEDEEKTCLWKAIEKGYRKLAMCLLSMEEAELLLEDEETILLEAIKKNYGEIANRILDLVDEHGFDTLVAPSSTSLNALHFAPLCQDPSLLMRLLERYPRLLDGKDKHEKTVLHYWIEWGKLWPFEYLQNKEKLDYERLITALHYVVWQFSRGDNKNKTPLHYVAEHHDEKFGVEVFQHLFRIIKRPLSLKTVFFLFDEDGFSPFKRAISNGHEKLAACFISNAIEVLMSKELSLQSVGAMLYKAVENNCHQVLQEVFDKLRQRGLVQAPLVRNMLTFDDSFLLKLDQPVTTPELYSFDARGLDLSDVFRSDSPETSHRKTLLHIAHKCTEEHAKFLIETYPELINVKDGDGKTPLDIASEAGATRVVELMLKKDHSSILKSPQAWITACENSHFSTILAFIDTSPYLRYLCREQRDTPLHHIKGLNYSEYHELLQRPLMKELKNTLNKDGKTPLHKAIENRDKDFAEILLQTSDVDRSIRDKNGKTPMDLLEQACQGRDDGDDWKEIRKRNEVDAFIRPDTDLTEMRSIISVVAALLATITFTVGFQLPGGVDGGEANLAKNAAFIVFLVSNVYAMCAAMLILFCIIWSMVCYKSESIRLINRSLVLLKQSLYGTLLAFMTGVYVVIYHKTLWVGIVVFFMCSFVILSAGKSILDRLLLHLPPAENDQFLRLLKSLKRIFNKKKDNASDGVAPASSETVQLHPETSCWASIFNKKKDNAPEGTTPVANEIAQHHPVTSCWRSVFDKKKNHHPEGAVLVSNETAQCSSEISCWKSIFNKKKDNVVEGATSVANETAQCHPQTSSWRSCLSKQRQTNAPSAATVAENEVSQDQVEALSHVV